MKLAKQVFLGLAVLGVVVFMAGVSFAQEVPVGGKDSSARKARHEARIKLLQDSVAVLQQANPNLAKKLSDLVNEDVNKSKEQLESGKEKIEKDSAEWKVKHEARVQLFKDAATALQQIRPDLAKSLEEMTVAKHKAEIQKATEEKNEKEEVGNLEPKSEQSETK